MECPKCYGNTTVLETRQGNGVKRRRECLECGYRFSTVEVESNLHKIQQRFYESCKKMMNEGERE